MAREVETCSLPTMPFISAMNRSVIMLVPHPDARSLFPAQIVVTPSNPFRRTHTIGPISHMQETSRRQGGIEERQQRMRGTNCTQRMTGYHEVGSVASRMETRTDPDLQIEQMLTIRHRRRMLRLWRTRPVSQPRRLRGDGQIFVFSRPVSGRVRRRTRS